MKKKRTTLDQVFHAILWGCVVGLIVSIIACLGGSEDALYAVMVFGALMNLPLFHFAMHWPLRESAKPEQAGNGQAATRPGSDAEGGDTPSTEPGGHSE